MSFKKGTKELFAERQQENRAGVVVVINSKANIEEEGTKKGSRMRRAAWLGLAG